MKRPACLSSWGLLDMCQQDILQAGEVFCIECRRKAAKKVCKICRDPYCDRSGTSPPLWSPMKGRRRAESRRAVAVNSWMILVLDSLVADRLSLLCVLTGASSRCTGLAGCRGTSGCRTRRARRAGRSCPDVSPGSRPTTSTRPRVGRQAGHMLPQLWTAAHSA